MNLLVLEDNKNTAILGFIRIYILRRFEVVAVTVTVLLTDISSSESDMDARDTLLAFLHDINPPVVYVEKNTVEEVVEANFDTFDDKNMRLLIDAALKERDANLKKGGKEEELLGSWGVVIDLIKTTTMSRRDRAGTMLQLVVNTGVKSGPKELQSLIATLKAQNKIDRVFTDLINTSYDDCVAQGNDVLADILKYTKTFIGVLNSKDKLAKSSSGAASPVPSGAGGANVTPTANKVSAVASSPKADTDKTSEPPPAPAAATTILVSPPAASAAKEESAAVAEKSAAEQAREARMISAGMLLQDMLHRSAGDVTALKTDAVERCITGEIDGAFLQVVEDNIKGCKEANYVNKLKVLEYLRNVVSSHLDGSARQYSETQLSNYAGNSNTAGMGTTTHHAPQFVDESQLNPNAPYGRGSKRHFADVEHIEVTLVPEAEKEFINAVEASAALRGTVVSNPTASASSGAVNPVKVNNKKKSAKSTGKKQIQKMATAAAEHLEKYGWAVLDNFVPHELVRRVRVESGLFRNSFEQSEIWVGKQADVGAQLSVPSVRGDKVLWMCGGHSSAAPEGMSRAVRTIGEIEPCKLEVKAQAPIRRFAAMKELVGTTDALVDAMKLNCTSLSGVYERSDAMLAVYPGEGSRFANHIDNSTGDGRRLTVVIYLNPNWKKEDGGALRIFPGTKYSGHAGTGAATAGGAESSAPQMQQAVDVYPEGGRLAMFYSADVAHEVLPTFADRHAITIWYYDQTERAEAVKRAREEGTASKVATATVQSQQMAKAFIGELMGGDEVSEDGGEPTESELQTLASKVTLLSDEIIGVVAAITGAPSVQSFRTGFPMLSTQDLKSMRALFRRMGLGSYAVA